MPDPSPYLPFTTRFETAGIRYVVGGGVAAILYGEPRLTLDLDVLLDLHKKQIPSLLEAFPAEQFYVPPADIIAMELGRDYRGHFNLYVHTTGMRADCYLRSRDPLDGWALDHPRKTEVIGGEMSLAPAVAVIVRKLEYFREGGSEKHVRDIQTILKMQTPLPHSDLLEKWIIERALTKEWSIITQDLDRF